MPPKQRQRLAGNPLLNNPRPPTKPKGKTSRRPDAKRSAAAIVIQRKYRSFRAYRKIRDDAIAARIGRRRAQEANLSACRVIAALIWRLRVKRRARQAEERAVAQETSVILIQAMLGRRQGWAALKRQQRNLVYRALGTIGRMVSHSRFFAKLRWQRMHGEDRELLQREEGVERRDHERRETQARMAFERQAHRWREQHLPVDVTETRQRIQDEQDEIQRGFEDEYEMRPMQLSPKGHFHGSFLSRGIVGLPDFFLRKSAADIGLKLDASRELLGPWFAFFRDSTFEDQPNLERLLLQETSQRRLFVKQETALYSLLLQDFADQSIPR